MNRKAVSGEGIMWMVRVMGVVIIVGIMVALVQGSISDRLDLKDLRFYPVSERALYSPDCFVYTNNARPYPGIIDIEKFSQERLNQCMEIIRRTISAKFTLEHGGEKEILYYNKETFEDLLPLTFSNKYMLVKERYYVLVYEDDGYIPGNMLVEVAWRK